MIANAMMSRHKVSLFCVSLIKGGISFYKFCFNVFFLGLEVHPVLGQHHADSECVTGCQKDWTANDHHCYFWSTSPDTWDQAEHTCRSKGGHLASVATSATSDYILSELTGRETPEDLWVGGKREDYSTVWKWTDGSLWDGNVTFWAEGRPDGGIHNDLKCLKFEAPDGKWRDKKCRGYLLRAVRRLTLR